MTSIRVIMVDNMMTMMGISIYWKNYEYLEHIKWLRVAAVAQTRLNLDLQYDRTQNSRTAYSRGEYKVDLYSLMLGWLNVMCG